jgi:ATP-dependent Clp protease adaptor protein ClpS
MTEKKDLKNKSNKADKTYEASLILYNDDVNSFEHVIIQLQEIVKHSEQQATQCTFMAHFKGTAIIEKGSHSYLKSLKDKLAEKGITTTIETDN